MNLKDRLRLMFKDTFLDLFREETDSPDNLEQALTAARSKMEQAADALAAFMVTHLHLKEAADKCAGQLSELNHQLESALEANDDEQARKIIRGRQSLEQEHAALNRRVEESEKQHSLLKERLDSMKTAVLEIEHRKIELQLRDRAAESIHQFNDAETVIDQSRQVSSDSNEEQEIILKENRNRVSADRKDTLDAKMDNLLEEDLIEQELKRLKEQRNKT